MLEQEERGVKGRSDISERCCNVDLIIKTSIMTSLSSVGGFILFNMTGIINYSMI